MTSAVSYSALRTFLKHWFFSVLDELHLFYIQKYGHENLKKQKQWNLQKSIYEPGGVTNIFGRLIQGTLQEMGIFSLNKHE